MADAPAGEPEERPDTERVGDSLRTAVERTLAATAGSAAETRQRARELLDEVARRGEVAREELGRRGDAARQEVARRGDAAKDEVTRRGEAAREEVARRSGAAREEVAKVGEGASSRLAGAISDLRSASPGESGPLAERIGAVERRLADLERVLRGSGTMSDAPVAEPSRGPDKPHGDALFGGKSKATLEGEGGAPAATEASPPPDPGAAADP